MRLFAPGVTFFFSRLSFSPFSDSFLLFFFFVFFYGGRVDGKSTEQIERERGKQKARYPDL
jgi:hypothetical protein